MPQADIGPARRKGILAGRNGAVLLAALAVLILGYVLLLGGSTSAAAVFLVIGYCVLFPLAIAL